MTQNECLRSVWWALALVTGGCSTLLDGDKEYHLAEIGGAGGGVTTDGGSTSTGGESTSTGGGGASTGGESTSTGEGSASTGAGGTMGDGGAAGVCAFGDGRCSGNTPQRCDENGQWQDEAACSGSTPICSIGACVSPPSCFGLTPTCGPGGDESCCAVTVVQEGTYNRGNDAEYPATVSGFRLDRFEITVGRFRAFLQAYPDSRPSMGVGAHPSIPGSGWERSWDDYLIADSAMFGRVVEDECMSPDYTWLDEGNDNRPMNCMTWYEAFAFCAWDGGRLPTEAEWNYVAAGGAEQRRYPWGATINPSFAVYGCTADEPTASDCVFPDDLPNVGSRSPEGDGVWHQADLAGSLWEWNLDWIVVPYRNPCIDCAVTQGGMYRVFRGGDWSDDPANLVSFARSSLVPTARKYFLGARCAR